MDLGSVAAYSEPSENRLMLPYPSLLPFYDKSLLRTAPIELKAAFIADEVIDLLPKRVIQFEFTSEPYLGGSAEFRFASEEIMRPVRKRYKRKLQKEFISAAKREIVSRWHGRIPAGKLLAVLEDYNIHHKLPVSLYGNNDFDNLVLINKKLHERIHTHIGKKIGKIQKKLKDHQRSKKKMFLSLLEDMATIEGVYIDADGRMFMEIPFPEGKTCIPQLILYSHHHGMAIQDEARNRSREPFGRQHINYG